jgi:hypothetical protein
MRETAPARFQPAWETVWAAWTAANFLAAILLILLGRWVINSSYFSALRYPFLTIVSVAAFVTALAQYAVLAWITPRPFGWLWASILGWWLGCMASAIIISSIYERYNDTSLFITPPIALFLGAAQWRYLRFKCLMRGANLWIPATLLGFLVPSLMFPSLDGLTWQMSLFIAIPGLSTGVVLANVAANNRKTNTSAT